jgi:hypothetical protein
MHRGGRGDARASCASPLGTPLSGVFQNIDLPPTPSPPGTRWVERGSGVNISEDAKHCSVLYIRKYFVGSPKSGS